MAAEAEQFYQILTTFLSPDNNIRVQAEEAYSKIPIETKVSHLLGAIHNANLKDEVRQIAAVLLRRVFANDFMDFYPKLSAETQTRLKEQVLLSVQQAQTELLRHKVCELVAELARNLLDDEGNNQWPEFLQFLFHCANDQNPVLKEAALAMFTSVPGIFGNQQNNYLDLIKQMLVQSLQPNETYEVKFQAVRAVGAFILNNEKETQITKHFVDLLTPMLMIIAESIHHQEDDSLLKVLIDLAENTPKFLRPQLITIYEMCMKTFSDLDALDSWRALALEVMVTLAEMAPAMVRKHAGKFMEQLVPLVLQMMADLDDESNWAESDELIDEDNDCNNVIAEAALDRLATGLGGKIILPLVTANIPMMLGSNDWKQRHAALMAISAVGEGCHKLMEPMLGQILDGVPGVMEGVLSFLRDPHPRVRHAACNAIGQMSTDFAPVFEKKFHDRVVPALLMLLDDNANPRVQAHAGAALVNFSEDCPKNILNNYLESLMSKLEAILTLKVTELLEKGTKLVLEQVVTTIASIADTAEKEFITYYDRLVPCLKYIIKNAVKDEYKLLRGKAIECITLIGTAVGPGKFASDATEVMDLLLATYGHQSIELPDDDPQTNYLISAWSRICKVLGKNFEPYLPLVMGPVMKTASMKPDVALLDSEEMAGMEGQEDDWQFVSLGEQKNFGIRTAGLDDKAAACTMLLCYARELKEAFAPYAEETVKLMVPMLKFYFHDNVRNAAAESLPWLLECAMCKGPAFVSDMWRYICPELLKAIDTEPENDVLIVMLYSLARCIHILGASYLNQDFLTETLKIVDKLMNDHFNRANDRHKKHLDEDYDEEVQEQLEDEESDDTYILTKITEVIHSLFLIYRENYIPYFDQVLRHFASLLAPNRSWADRQWGICVFDDVIEYTGPLCSKYQGYFLQPFALYVRDKSCEVRQAAAYGWGALAQFGGEQFATELAKILPTLVEVINDPDSRDPRNLNATENVISAVTKIMKYNNSQINLNEIIPIWFSWLPVIEDTAETPHIYGYMCDLIEQNHPGIIGPNNANIPKIIVIIAQAFQNDAIEPNSDVGTRMIMIVRQVQSNDGFFQSVVQSMSPELQHALHIALHTPT